MNRIFTHAFFKSFDKVKTVMLV